MRTEIEIKEKIIEVQTGFKQLNDSVLDIEDPESIIDCGSAMIASSLSLHILKWVLNDEEEQK